MELLFSGFKDQSFFSHHRPVLRRSDSSLTVHPTNEESTISTLLSTTAVAISEHDHHLAAATLSLLDKALLHTPSQANSTSLFRLAKFFSQGLKSRLCATTEQNFTISENDQIFLLTARLILLELSPYIKFAHFSANQAILEAAAGNTEVHIIDFDIADGIQWPPLMIDLARRPHPSLHITAAVLSSNQVATLRSTGSSLAEFAESIGLKFTFDYMPVQEMGKRIITSSPVMANCVSHQLQTVAYNNNQTSKEEFLDSVKKLSPKIIVVAEEELMSGKEAQSFEEHFKEVAEHFCAVSESLECSLVGGYRKGLHLLEREVLGPKIVGCLSNYEGRQTEREHHPYMYVSNTEELMEAGGEYRAAPLSDRNLAHAKSLVGIFNRGFRVEHGSRKLTLVWNGRPLLNVAVWVPNY